MAVAYKVLGQSAPSATTETDLYTVGASTQAVCSTVVCCNRGGTATTFRIYVAPAGAVTSNAMYLVYDATIAANDVYMATIGITLEATDVVRVYAGNGNLSFSLFGSEIT